MEQNDFREILKRYLSGGASEHEIQIVEKWYQEIGRQREGTADTNETKLEEQYLTNIMKQVGKSHRSKMVKAKPGVGLPRYFVAIAASLLLLIVSMFVITKKTVEKEKQIASNESAVTVWTDIVNTSAVAQTYNLPDGSNVTLQPNSNIKFSTPFNVSIREVQLEGEGFFDVIPNKDKPFIVYANDVTTRVLGTSFTIRSFHADKQVTVVVKTGKVSVLTKSAVTPSEAEEIILTPNQEIVYDRAEKIVQRRIVETPEPLVLSEETKPMRFEEAPLNEIVEAIEKVYGVNIEYDENKFATCVLTTSISGRGLFNRMDIITSAIGATYELKEDRIVIRGTGCNHYKK